MQIRTRLIVALTLAIAAVPSHAQENLNYAMLATFGDPRLELQVKPLDTYLTRTLQLNLRRVAVADADAIVAGMAKGTIDLAWIDAYSLLQLQRLDPASRPLVQRPEDAASRSLVVTMRDDIHSLDDLRGKRFAFGSARSTSGWLMAADMLQQQGIVAGDAFTQVAFAPRTALSLRWLAQGNTDAAVIDAQHWRRIEQSSRGGPPLRVIARSEPFADYSWGVRGGLPEQQVEALKTALLALDPDQPSHRKVLTAMGAQRYVPAKPWPYASVVRASQVIGRLK